MGFPMSVLIVTLCVVIYRLGRNVWIEWERERETRKEDAPFEAIGLGLRTPGGGGRMARNEMLPLLIQRRIVRSRRDAERVLDSLIGRRKVLEDPHFGNRSCVRGGHNSGHTQPTGTYRPFVLQPSSFLGP
jgi:hypothetical protein